MAAVPGIEGRLPHEPVDPALGAQPPVGVVAGETDGGALDARHFPRRHLDQLGLEPPALAPAQIHPEQHLRPVLRLGAAGPGLDVDERAGGVHLAGEHPAELQSPEPFVESRDLRIDLGDDRGVGFLLGQAEERLRIVEAGVEPVEELDRIPQPRPLAAKGLRSGGIVPDAGRFELAIDLLQPLAARLDVKDTPSERRGALACP